MPPKKPAKPAVKSSSTSKQIDDFIGQSEMAEGQEASLIRNELHKERVKELTEKFYDVKSPAVVQMNMRSLTEVRTLSTIFVGMAAGILNFGGLGGMLFYFSVDLILGLMLLVYFGFKAEPYFPSITTILFNGLGQNVMTFMVMWVLFHNLVYVL